MSVSAILLALGLASAAPVLTGLDPLQAEVSYADLDLASDAGRATLERRVNAAVRLVCPMSGALPLDTRRAATRCRAVAMRDAAEKIELAVTRSRMDRRLASAGLAVVAPR